MTDETHYFAITLPGWTEHTDVAAITVGRAEPADDQGCPARLTDWIFTTNLHIERLVWCRFTEPRLEIIKQSRHCLNVLAI